MTRINWSVILCRIHTQIISVYAITLSNINTKMQTMHANTLHTCKVWKRLLLYLSPPESQWQVDPETPLASCVQLWPWTPLFCWQNFSSCIAKLSKAKNARKEPFKMLSSVTMCFFAINCLCNTWRIWASHWRTFISSPWSFLQQKLKLNFLGKSVHKQTQF